MGFAGACFMAGAAAAQNLLAPFGDAASASAAPVAPAAPWQFAGLPGTQVPRTAFQVVREPDAPRALRIAAAGSYGNLVHPVAQVRPGILSWRWRLDQPNAAADIRSKSGDDLALKVCAMFDLPDSAVPFLERQLLRMARSASGEPLPAATLCYVWDNRLPPGTVLDNVYSRRLRMMVLRGPEANLRTWHGERRDLAEDFLKLFGDEARQAPPLRAIALGADADNTQGHSLGWVAEPALK